MDSEHTAHSVSSSSLTKKADPAKAWAVALGSCLLVVALGGLYVYVVGVTGCHLIYPFDVTPPAETDYIYYCDVPVKSYPTEPEYLNFKIKVGPTGNEKPYPTPLRLKTAIKNAVSPLRVYSDPNVAPYVLVKSELVRLGRYYLVKPRYGDRTKAHRPWLEITVDKEVDGVYLLYDHRATPKKYRPNWLDTEYTLQRDPGSRPGVIKISRTDAKGKVIPDKYMNMHLWKRNATPQPGQAFTIPGNARNHHAPFPKDNLTMYLVLIKPKMNVQYAKPKVESAFKKTDIKVCAVGETVSERELDARKKACQKCNELLGKERFHILADRVLECCREGNSDVQIDKDSSGKVPCDLDPNPGCCTKTSSLTSTSDPYGARSVATALPTSSWNVTVRDEGGEVLDTMRNIKSGGTIYFDYVANTAGQMPQLVLDDMFLRVLGSAIQVEDVGTFTDIALTLVGKSPVAECQDAAAPIGAPCARYDLAQGALSLAVGCEWDGASQVWYGKNRKKIQVQIDATSGDFTLLGGAFTTLVKVKSDGKLKRIQLTIEPTVYGKIVNFVPHPALGGETLLVSECADDRNEYPITLHASDSFDSLGNITQVEWYQNYGELIERNWTPAAGASYVSVPGDLVTIPRDTLPFGVHRFSLVVADNAGTHASDSFDVSVVDTKPPVFDTYPPNLWVIGPGPSSPFGLVEVALGTVTAHDTCSPDVLVTNDASGGFAPGNSWVTWTADDARGNRAETKQWVYISQPRDLRHLVNCGTLQPVTDAGGKVWQPDLEYLAPDHPQTQVRDDRGEAMVDMELLSSRGLPPEFGPAPEVFLTERSHRGDIHYQIPGLAAGTYVVLLYFSENCVECVGPQWGGTNAEGAARIFDIQVGEHYVADFNQAQAALPHEEGQGATFVATELGFQVSLDTGQPLDIRIIDRGSGDPAIKAFAVLETPNMPPLAFGDTTVIEEDAFAEIDVLANDADPDGDTLTIGAITEPNEGVAEIAGTTISYVPFPDFNGTDSFEYTVTDENGGVTRSTVTVIVTPVNDEPEALDDASVASLTEGRSFPIDVLRNDRDVDGDVLTVEGVGDPENGTAINFGTHVVYVPEHDFSGMDFFEYSVTDGNGGHAQTMAMVEVTPIPPGHLIVETRPVSGEIFVDGVSWGLAPQGQPLPPGEHAVSFGDVPCYERPADQQVFVVEGPEPAIVVGEYLPAFELELSPPLVEVPAEGGTASFSVAHTCSRHLAWSAEVLEGSEWLRIVEEVGGTNEGSLVVECDPNPGSEPRGGLIAVATNEAPAVGVTGEVLQVGTSRTAPFWRGEANGDHVLDISDAICVLLYLFNGEEGPCRGIQQCVDAADVDDDGSVDISDPVTMLRHLFTDRGPLPEPSGRCGSDPTVDELTCERYPSCP